MKRVICLILSLLVILNTNIVFAEEIVYGGANQTEIANVNRDIGLYRFEKVVSERTGKETEIISIFEVDKGKHWTVTVNAVSWVKGEWDFTLYDTKPEAPAGIRNWYWFCLYDEAYNRLGYILATKK